MSLFTSAAMTAGASALAASIADRNPKLATLRATDPVLYSAIIGAVAGAFMAGLQMASADTPMPPQHDQAQYPPLPGGIRLP
jgi:hypothetical protein